MTEDFIRNFRRAPRVLARLRARIGSGLDAETEDVGPGGCRLASPRPFAVGDSVRISLEADCLMDPLRVSGRVAWRSTVRRLRLGIAYDEASAPVAARWFQRFVDSSPGLAVRMIRVPQMIAYSTPLAHGPGPVSPLHTEEELALYAEVRGGVTVRELLAKDPARAKARANAIFSLVGSHALVLEGGWHPAPTPAPVAPAAAAPAPAGRSAEAQEKLERAKRLVAEGNSAAAIPLLREALRHAPKDPEISTLLARAAFGGRG